MAFRTWAKLSGTAIGAAALAAASQLGLAYGLGVVRLTRVIEVTDRDIWTAQLAWVAWIAMTSAAIGGMVARSRLPRQSGAGTRIAVALAAGLGAAAVVPLTMQPARTTLVAGVHPEFVIGVCAGLGALAGIPAAYAALSRAVARWSLTTLLVAVWVVAVASVAPSLAPGDELPAARLGVLDAAVLGDSVIRRTALLTMPVLALIAGLVLGLMARRRQLSTWTIALAGLPGPALLTAAYLIAGPGAGPDSYEMVPYWGAMTAAGAGVLGSVLAAVLRRAPESPQTPETRPHSSENRPHSSETRPQSPESRPETLESTPENPGKPAGKAKRGRRNRKGAEPTPDRPPLPRRDAQAASSAIAEAAATAAQRPEEQLRPSDTGVIKMPPFDGFAAASRPRAEPQPVNPPPTAPPPVTPPLGVASVPPASPAPPQGVAPVPPQSRKDDGDFVDWVSGLGNR